MKEAKRILLYTSYTTRILIFSALEMSEMKLKWWTHMLV